MGGWALVGVWGGGGSVRGGGGDWHRRRTEEDRSNNYIFRLARLADSCLLLVFCRFFCLDLSSFPVSTRSVHSVSFHAQVSFLLAPLRPPPLPRLPLPIQRGMCQSVASRVLRTNPVHLPHHIHRSVFYSVFSESSSPSTRTRSMDVPCLNPTLLLALVLG